jgi:ABC-type sugar transport system ATPase subunit
MSKVTLDGLTKRFGEVEAVKNITLKIEDGELVVLLGPSGCGKTTTLRCIAGLEKPDKGHIYIGDKKVTELSPPDRNVAMVFQSYALYPHMKAFDNIAFPLWVRKRPKGEISKRVKKTSEILEIFQLLNRKPGELSGGQCQRVALGRAIIRNPEVFLLDEPLANLDAKLRASTRGEIKRLQKQLGTTMIFVTHDQVEAMTMAERIAVMNNGVVEQFGSPDEIYQQPENTFVASFIGTPPMNLIECSLAEGEKISLTFDNNILSVPTFIGRVLIEKLEVLDVVFGIRPEDILIWGENKPNSYKTKVYLVEPLGYEKLVTVEMGNTHLKVRTGLDFNQEIGELAWVDFNWNRTHFFNKKTGKAIMHCIKNQKNRSEL